MLDSNGDDNTSNDKSFLELKNFKISNTGKFIQNLTRHHSLSKKTPKITEPDELSLLNLEKNDDNFKLSPKFLKTLRRRSKTYSGEEIQIILNDDTNSSESSNKYCVSKSFINSKNEIIKIKENNDIITSNLTTLENNTCSNNLEIKLIKKNNEVSLSTSRRFHFFIFLNLNIFFINFIT
jgi:hypothetical protein